MRVKVTLACTECKQRNYNTVKNKKNDPDRIELKKYCKFCRKETLHKETKQEDFRHGKQSAGRRQEKGERSRIAIFISAKQRTNIDRLQKLLVDTVQLNKTDAALFQEAPFF